MWLYTKEAGEAIETLTYLPTGAQILRTGESDKSELWFRGNSLEAALEHDEMRLAGSNGDTYFQSIVDALMKKGDLAGYTSAGVTHPIPGE